MYGSYIFHLDCGIVCLFLRFIRPQDLVSCVLSCQLCAMGCSCRTRSWNLWFGSVTALNHQMWSNVTGALHHKRFILRYKFDSILDWPPPKSPIPRRWRWWWTFQSHRTRQDATLGPLVSPPLSRQDEEVIPTGVSGGVSKEWKKRKEEWFVRFRLKGGLRMFKL